MPTPDPSKRPQGAMPPFGRSKKGRTSDSESVTIFEEERRRLKRRLELQELVHEFSSQMRSQRDIESIGTVLSDAVSELTSFRNTFMTLLDDDGKTLRGVSLGGHRRTREIGLRLTRYNVNRIRCNVDELPSFSKALKDGEIVIHETKEDIVKTLSTLTGLNPGILEIVRRTIRMNLGVTVPLFIGHPERNMTPLGILSISAIKPKIDEEDLRVVRILAAQASLALHNVKLLNSLKDQTRMVASSEARIRNMIDSAHDMIIAFDTTGEVNLVNKAFRESEVYNVQGDLFDEQTLERVHPDDQPTLVEAYLDLKGSNPIHGVEYRIRGENGAWLHHNLNAVTIVDEDDEVVEFVTFIRDVTHERKRERQLVRRNKELEVLNDLITNLSTFVEVDEIVKRSLTIIAEFTMSDMIGFLARDEEDPEKFDLVGTLWVPEGILEELSKALKLLPKMNLLLDSEVQTLDDAEELPPKYFRLALKLRMSSFVSVPVKIRGRNIGYVIAAAADKMPLDEEDIAILNAVGDQLGLVLEIARLMRAVGNEGR